MIRRLLHIICSLWLATLLLLGNTPAEAIHAFAHHRDTVHQKTAGPVIDAQHHHCQFLGFHLMPFDQPVLMQPFQAKAVFTYTVFVPAQDERATQQAVALREGRGPPSA